MKIAKADVAVLQRASRSGVAALLAADLATSGFFIR